MRRDGRMAKVWRAPVFVCNIITSPWVMTQRERERERLMESRELCFCMCMFKARMHVLTDESLKIIEVRLQWLATARRYRGFKCDFDSGDITAPVVKLTFMLPLPSYSPLNNIIQPNMKVWQSHRTEIWDKDALFAGFCQWDEYKISSESNTSRAALCSRRAWNIFSKNHPEREQEHSLWD